MKKNGFVCVTELMDHVIDESERVYKGTMAEGKFFIFHDCLLQWCKAETWMKCAPTSDHIVEDIVRIVPVLDKIIEAKGGVVPDECYRTGRRWRRVDNEGDCTRKPRVRQRKATLVATPYHPELAAA